MKESKHRRMREVLNTESNSKTIVKKNIIHYSNSKESSETSFCRWFQLGTWYCHLLSLVVTLRCLPSWHHSVLHPGVMGNLLNQHPCNMPRWHDDTMPPRHDGMAGIQGPMPDLHVPMLSPKCWKAAFQTPFGLNFVSIIPATRITSYNSSQAIQIIKIKKDNQRKQRQMRTGKFYWQTCDIRVLYGHSLTQIRATQSSSSRLVVNVSCICRAGEDVWTWSPVSKKTDQLIMSNPYHRKYTLVKPINEKWWERSGEVLAHRSLQILFMCLIMSDVRRWSDIKNSTWCSVCKWPGEMRPYLSWKCMELSEQMNDNECSMVLSCVMPCRTSKILEWFARSLARPDVRTCQLFNTATISKADLPIGDTYRDFDLLCDPWSPGHRKSLPLELSAFEVTWSFWFQHKQKKRASKVG